MIRTLALSGAAALVGWVVIALGVALEVSRAFANGLCFDCPDGGPHPATDDGASHSETHPSGWTR